MEENIQLEKELSLLKQQYDETKKRAKMYKSEKDKLQDLYVFFHKDQKMKSKNCERCERSRHEIIHLCKEAPRIINRTKEMESRRKELKETVFDSYKERFKELEKEKQKIHKKALYHIVFVEEGVGEANTLKQYLKDEIYEAEWNKAKAERKRVRKINRRNGTWNRKYDSWYNSDTDSDPETVQRKKMKKRAKETMWEDGRWYWSQYDFSLSEKKAALKLQYNHQTVSDDEDMPQEIGTLDCASDLQAKFAAQQLATDRLKQSSSAMM